MVNVFHLSFCFKKKKQNECYNELYGFIVPSHLANGRDNEFYKIYLLKHYIQFQLVFSGIVVIK